MKKYKLTKETREYGSLILYRIEAIRHFGNVRKGEKGGFVENEENLNHDGNAWVYGNAWVSGDARVSGDAEVYGNAWVYDNARVSGDARVSGNAEVYGNAWVSGDARVSGDAEVYDNARVSGDAEVSGKKKVVSGYLFGIRYKKEEIKYEAVDDDTEIIYKGDNVFVEDEDNECGDIIEVNGVKYKRLQSYKQK